MLTKNAKLKILKLRDLYRLELAIFIFKFKSKQLPSIFMNYFTRLNTIY